jgi:hypothetical protein
MYHSVHGKKYVLSLRGFCSLPRGSRAAGRLRQTQKAVYHLSVVCLFLGSGFAYVAAQAQQEREEERKKKKR